MPTRKEQADALERAKKFLEECQQHHDEFMRGVDRRADAYHAVVQAQKEIADDVKWRSRLYPPYAMHIVDSTLASMVEDRLRYKIRPRMSMAFMLDPREAEKARIGAEAHQILMDWQNRQTKFTRLQRPFLLQNSIAKLTVAKTYWTERNERRRRMVTVDESLTDEYGDQIILPGYGPLTFPKLVEETGTINVYDGPDTEVIDVHDFFWPKNAPNMGKARYVAHRIWISREELERGFRDGGPYGPNNGGWSWNKVQKLLGETRSNRDTYGPRWGKKGEATHDFDNLEVVEVWDNFLKEVITFVGRSALIAYKQEFPFFHEQPPFVVCSTQPDLFEFAGISQVEKVAALQEMLWAISNQRIDNLRLINNAIVIFRPDLEDADAYPFEPGALWPMEDPEQVQMWHPDPIPAEISIGAESLLKGDMQNLASTFPFSSGAESQTVDQKTATGASIVSALAQRSIDMAKQPVYDAWEDIGNQKVILNNQFIREPVAATVLGLDGEEVPVEIWPEMLAGDFEYIQEPVPDALMQQQEQAKALAVFQTLTQAAPLLLPLAQAGAASMLNMDALIEYVLKSHGIEDTKQFFISKAPPMGLGGAQQGGGASAPPEQNLGITGPGSIDPAVSPGAQVSESPETMMQRALALGGGGGGRNA